MLAIVISDSERFNRPSGKSLCGVLIYGSHDYLRFAAPAIRTDLSESIDPDIGAAFTFLFLQTPTLKLVRLNMIFLVFSRTDWLRTAYSLDVAVGASPSKLLPGAR
jgi:hypothetical protein